jgi:hypothetical protein
MLSYEYDLLVVDGKETCIVYLYNACYVIISLQHMLSYVYVLLLVYCKDML